MFDNCVKTKGGREEEVERLREKDLEKKLERERKEKEMEMESKRARELEKTDNESVKIINKRNKKERETGRERYYT